MAVVPMRARNFVVQVDVSVVNTRVLWDGTVAALRREAGRPGAHVIDDGTLTELIGAREAPDAGACLQYLLTPSELPGCRVRQSSVDERGANGGPG